MSFVVRRAALADAAAITRVQVAAWQTTYAGLVQPTYLDSMKSPDYVRRRTEGWAQGIANPQQFTHVAEATTGIFGFAAGGKCRNEQPEFAMYDGELYAIYILAQHQGQGVGRRLVTAVACDLCAAGYQHMLIWVLRENQPARQFYERLGGQTVGELRFHIADQPLVEVGYGYALCQFACCQDMPDSA